MVSRLWWLLASAVVATAPATAPDYRSLSNLDFEQGVVDSFPPGWVARGALRRGFKVALSDDQPHAGRFSALIRRDSLDWRDSGVLGKRLDARPYRGRRVRVAGWLRFQGIPSNVDLGMAGLTLQVYRVGGRDGFYGDTDDRPVRSAAWARREVLGEVAEDADTLAFGGYLTAGGRAWMDDISLTPLGPNGEGDQPARPLTERGTENLVAFGRLLGYVRYFHPSDESAGTEWDSFAIAGVDEVEGAATPEALVATLERLFGPIAPTVRIATHRLSPLTPTMLRPAGTHPELVTGWWHHGWGSTHFSFYYDRRPVVSAELGSDSIATIGSDVSTSLGGGVWCSVPLSLYVDSKGTLPHGSARALLPRRPEGWLPTGNDRATRLADVIQLWNIPQHFYPYFDVVGTDWPAQLPLALRRAAEDRDGASFEMTVRRLVAQLHDGHGSVNSPYGDPRPLPLAWDFVESKLVVLRADSSYADRLHPGDEVTTIQGRPVTEWVKEAEPTKCAATPQWLRLRVAETLQVMTRADTVALEVRSPAGDRRRVLLPRQSGGLRKPARPDSITQLAPGVMYLDFDRITDADFSRALPELLRAKGVIFDLRGYPNRISVMPLAHLTHSPMTSPRWYFPVVTRPDHQDMKFEFANWPVQPLAPRIQGRVAFLIDGRAISAAETLLGIVEHYHLADLVGEPTAGTNGNINLIDLPGGYTVTFTGMKVLKHDGSRHHGVGILPTVPVSPTIAGIAAGRDEQLEKAIEVVSRRRR